MKKRILSILDTAPKKTGAVILCAALFLIAISGSFIMITKIINDDLEKNLNLLKSGDTKPLVGFAIGDSIDYELVEDTGEYRSGGRISKLKSGKYSDIYLFFGEATNRLVGLGAEETGNFFGIVLGETDLQIVTDILGQPDVYNEISDMWDTPEAIYYFEKNTLFLNMDSEYKITRITYKTQINDRFADEVPNEDDFSDLITFWNGFREAVLSEDSNEIKKYVRFPLKTRGAYDDDPVIEFNEDRFSEVFAVFLGQDEGVGLGDNLNFIEGNEILKCMGTEEYRNANNHKDITLVEGNWARAGDMRFEKEGGKWLLTFIYIYNENYKKLNINIEEIIQETESPTEIPSGHLYVNERLGFSVEFPAEWDGLFVIGEDYIEHSARGGAGISVYHKATYESNHPYLTGILFHIERWIGTWTLEEPPVWAGGCSVFLQSDKYTYVLRTTSGVEYDANDEQTEAECQMIFEQLDFVRQNIKSIDNMYAGEPAEKEFLDSYEGKQLCDTAYSAAIAMLKADADELAKYLIDPSGASRRLRNITDIYNDLAWLCFKFTLDSIKPNGDIWASYEYALTGEDSYSYVSMTLKKVDDGWRVSEIGLEK